MNNKNKKVIIAVILIFILVLLLLWVIKINNPTNTSIFKQYIAKEKLNLDEVSRITVIYNYNLTQNDNKKLELSLTGEKASNLIEKLKNYAYPNYTGSTNYVFGDYQMVLSNGIEFLFDKDNAVYDDEVCKCVIGEEKFLTTIPGQIRSEIVDMVNNELASISSIYNTDKIVVKQDNTELIINDNDIIKNLLENCKNIYEFSEVQNQNIIYEILFNEDTKLQVYEQNNYAKLVHNNIATNVRVPKRITSYCEAILNNNKNNLKNKLTTNSIILEQYDKKIEITDYNIINDIINKINNSSITYKYDNDSLIDKLKRETDVMLTFDKVKILFLADANGLITGTTGYIINQDKTIDNILVADDLSDYIEDLLKKM